ncbi:unnamed protein product [Caenorhabditis bovis]|uniref:BTB domain-containing protein n=1 Tax=Caenorhabditis bovis TaxID=2654633 RepID=A0A8S1F5T3_9PELO|nr:unnamed protein product [Caenorhabditis bovis]
MSQYSYDYLTSAHETFSFEFIDVRKHPKQISLDLRVFNLLWSFILGFNHSSNNEPPTLSAKIECSNDEGKKWECEAKIDMKIISKRSNELASYKHCIGQWQFSDKDNSKNLEYSRKLSGVHLVIRAGVRIYWATGLTEIFDPFKTFPILGDVVLIIGKKRLISNKTYLSVHSPIFRKLFTDHPEQEEFVLNDVGFDDFILLHNVILPSGVEVQYNNYQKLMKMAEQFRMDHVLKKCEDYLIWAISFDVPRSLQWSDLYGKEELDNDKIEAMDRRTIMKFIESDEFRMLSNSCRAALLIEIFQKLFPFLQQKLPKS